MPVTIVQTCSGCVHYEQKFGLVVDPILGYSPRREYGLCGGHQFRMTVYPDSDPCERFLRKPSYSDEIIGV